MIIVLFASSILLCMVLMFSSTSKFQMTLKADSIKSTVLKTKEQPITHSQKCVKPNPQSNPAVFLHIGPPKTGTTSLQDYLACNTEILSKYNTMFLGKVNYKDVEQCESVPTDFDRPMVQYRSERGMRKLRAEIIKLRLQDQSVILSDEDYGNVPVELLGKLFANMTHVYPIVAYRRYYDWLLSYYKFTYQPKWYEPMWNNWEGHKTDSIPSFRAFLKEFDGASHPTLKLMHMFSGILQEVTEESTCPQVLNLHEGEITEQIMTVVTGTNHTDKLPAPTASNVNHAAQFAVDMERLALKLYHQGIVPRYLARRKFVSMLQSQLDVMYVNSTPPLDCFSAEEENALLNKTKVAESMIVPDYFQSPEGEVALVSGFWRASIKKSFCNIDLDAMLNEDAWLQFLMTANGIDSAQA